MGDWSKLILRRLLGVVAVLMLVVMVTAFATGGFLTWALNTESGLRFVSNQGSAWMRDNLSQTLEITQPEGDIWEGAVLGGLVWSDGETIVRAENLAFKVDFLTLMDQRVWVRSLTADSIAVSLPKAKADAEEAGPVVLPESLVLPVVIDIDQLAVGNLDIDGQKMRDIVLKAELNQRALDIQQLALAHDEGSVALVAQVGVVRPYTIKADANLQRQAQALDIAGKVNLTGTLERIILAINAQAKQQDNAEAVQSVVASAVVKPFSKALLEAANIQAEGFNPADWTSSLPSAALDIDLSLEPNANLTVANGKIRLQNALAGRLDANKIPVRAVEAEYQLVLADAMPSQVALQIEKLLLASEAGGAGELVGQVDWRLPVSFDNLLSQPGTLGWNLTLANLEPGALINLPFDPVVNATVVGDVNENRLQLASIDIEDRGAKVSGNVTVGLTGQGATVAQLSVQQVNLQNYQAAGSGAVTGLVRAELDASGDLGASWLTGKFDPAGKVNLNTAGTKVSGADVDLNMTVTGGKSRLAEVDLAGRVSGAVVQAQGAFGAPGDVLDFVLDVPKVGDLAKLVGMKAGGNLTAKGQLAGNMGSPTLMMKAQANDVMFEKSTSFKSLSVNIQAGLAPDSPLSGDIQMKELKSADNPETLIKTLTVKLSGVTKQHALRADFETGLTPFSRRRVLNGQLAVKGGLDDKSGHWKGVISDTELGGLWRPVNSLKQVGTTPVEIGKGLVAIGALALAGEENSLITSEEVALKAGESVIRGKAEGLTLPRIRSLTATLVSFETKFLVTDVNWKIEANPNDLNGHVDLVRKSGGFAILEDSEIDVPVNDLRLDVDFSREAVKAELNLDAEGAGVITASATLPVEKDETTQSWGLATTKPMEAAFVAGLTDLKWLGPLASPTLRSAGSGQVSIVVNGSLDNPKAEGIAFARGLDLFELGQGIRLEDGVATVFFNNDRVEIREMDFTVYNRNVPRNRLDELAELIQGVGKLSVRGDWYIAGTGGEVTVKLDRVGLLQRADRWMMADGKIVATQPSQADEPIVVRGDVSALGAYIEIPDSGPTTLGDDVVLRGRQGDVSKSGALDLELVAKLGDKFYLNAQGLRSRLAGQLQLNLQQGVKTASGRTGNRIAANGTIQAVDGTYRAYGQDLTIERGVVNFQGPLANPGLNIRAVRKGVAVEAGVEVTGSAARPQVTLVSEPPVPDSEKLSWMIIGRGSDSSDRDANLLLTAAAAIFGDSDESTTRKIAKSIGIDDFALTSGSLTAADSRAVGSQVSIAPGADPSAAIVGEDDPLLTQRIITLGKRLNDEITLFFEQSVTTAANIVKLNYQYSRRLSFILRGGADNAVDALYQFSFD